MITGARSNETKASLTVMQPAQTRAEITLNSPVIQRVPVAPIDTRYIVIDWLCVRTVDKSLFNSHVKNIGW